ncbi:glycosyltransferase family 4 protein [Agarivorans sp. JK6]|uniref:glycosyltransferase family 4 protein n=1 Tax=Agarivorans sp. JK6 TaxID=2997426 RepID=UPI003873CBD4
MNELDGNCFLVINESHEGAPDLKDKFGDRVELINIFSRHKWRSLDLFRNPKLKMAVKGCLLLVAYPIIFFQLLLLFIRNSKFSELMIVNGGFPGGDSCNVAILAWFIVKRKKCWYNFHNNARPYRYGIGLFQRFFDWLIDFCVEGFITVSNDCAKSMLVRKGVSNSIVKVVYNGIQAPRVDSSFKFGGLAENRFRPGSCQSIVMLGTFEERKGHEFLFSAMAKLPQYCLLVCGSGTQEEQRRLRELSSGIENIFFLGFRDDSHSIIQACDLLVVPSKENESFGLTIIEAMSLDTPVIATRVGGMKEVIEHEKDGLLVSYGNVDELVDSISKILENESYRKLLTNNAYISFQRKYTASVMAQNYKNIIGW